MMAFVFKSKRRVNGKVRAARTWSGQYRLPGDLKPIGVARGVSGLVAKGQSESAAIPIKDHGPILLSAGGQSLSPLESASVGESSDTQRVRDAGFEPATSCV